MGKIQRIAQFTRPTVFGEFDVVSYFRGGDYSFAITKGKLPADDLLVRIQSPCLFGESFGVNSCDCAAQMQDAMKIGAKSGAFLLVYMLEQEGRGLGMFQKIKAVETEAVENIDMIQAFEKLRLPLDLREYSHAAQIIRDVNGDRPIRLMTNNPKKVEGLEEEGLKVTERIPLLVEPPNEQCRKYLSSKKRKMGHILPHVD